MRIISAFVFILLLSVPVLSQAVDTIVQKNLFDPQRGQVDVTDDVSGPVEKELPKDIPILDGIITIGSYQRVIFRYRDGKTHKLVSGVFKKGDQCADAKIIRVTENEVTIVYMNRKYKMTVDSKDKLKNVPKTSGFHHAGTRSTPRSATAKIVERKTISPRRKTPVMRSPRRPTGVSRQGGASTPFGGGGSRARKRPRPSRKTTPF